MKLYKVINEDKLSMNGGDFDWKDYLPKGKRKGKWTPRIEDTKICERGYHLTKHWNMWINSEEDMIFEAEVKEEDIDEWDYDKCVCKSIRLIKQIYPKFDKKWNTGNWNTGDGNTGNKNTGDENTGYKNTGNWNTGNWNTGYWNTGDENTGDENTGKWNTGDGNTGNWNTGNWNTGKWNTGNKNTGNKNTGDENTGNWNTGNWNSANQHVGNFNSKPPQYIELFNKPISRKEYEKISFPDWLYMDLEEDYKNSFKEAFNDASVEQIQKTIDLPNFDYDVFEEITGITKDMIQEKLKGDEE